VPGRPIRADPELDSSGVDHQIMPLNGKMTGRNIMSDEIDHERRRFFGATAMTTALHFE
jgi:hypothetical protein